ncbi:hypothetical protein ACU8V6_00195 [Vibrio alginolyticus]
MLSGCSATTKITTAVVVVAIAGLVAVAAPAVIGAAPAVVRRGLVGVGALRHRAFHGPDESRGEAEQGGLVELGDGISVPAGGPGDCTTNALINIYRDDGSPMHAKLLGELVEMGASELASGPVTLDAAGEDLLLRGAGRRQPHRDRRAILRRLRHGLQLQPRARQPADQPGDTLYLRPDPTLPFVTSTGRTTPSPAPPPSPTTTAWRRSSTAVATADLGAARWLWKRLEKDMHPETAAVITQALSDDDLPLLRRLFP